VNVLNNEAWFSEEETDIESEEKMFLVQEVKLRSLEKFKSINSLFDDLDSFQEKKEKRFFRKKYDYSSTLDSDVECPPELSNFNLLKE
jgi:hypothetical protein